MAAPPPQLLLFGLIALFAVLTAAGIWFMIFRAPLVPHLIRIFDDEDVETSDDAKEWFLKKELEALKSREKFRIFYVGFASGVYHCSDCQGVWTGLLAAVIITIAGLFFFGPIALVFLALWPAGIPLAKILQKL